MKQVTVKFTVYVSTMQIKYTDVFQLYKQKCFLITSIEIMTEGMFFISPKTNKRLQFTKVNVFCYSAHKMKSIDFKT